MFLNKGVTLLCGNRTLSSISSQPKTNQGPFISSSPDISRLDKSPLLANGYNPPPTHLSHMQFMQMNHHPGAAGLLNSGSMPPHGMPRPDSAALLKGQGGMPGMNAIAK